MLAKDIEIALEDAVYCIQKKELKKEKRRNSTVKKIFNKQKYELITEQTLTQEELKARLEEGKKSLLIRSPQNDRKYERRQAVFERNETERQLVRSTVKNHMINQQMQEYYLN